MIRPGTIDSAAILAAGVGSRLRDQLQDRPKGFLQLGRAPIIEESIARLQHAGIRHIVIVTGYRNEYYDRLASQYPECLRTVRNDQYASSGSLFSLYQARHLLTNPFLLLESDIIYEPRALQALLEGPQDSVLLSGPTGAGDEVYVETRDGALVAMSKDRNALQSTPAGELVGISRISCELFGIMIDEAETMFRSTLNVHYETDGLVAAARKREIRCPVIEDLLWAEIDDASQLARAKDRIYPRLPAAGLVSGRAVPS